MKQKGWIAPHEDNPHETGHKFVLMISDLTTEELNNKENLRLIVLAEFEKTYQVWERIKASSPA